MAKRKTTPAVDQTRLTIEQIPVDSLKPNPWNPNRMSDAEYAELVAEVKHLGRLPKPVVVRRNCDGFEIVDGEHGWRAARECGLKDLPCEVIEADDFEAMRQTYKRNQHGKHDVVMEGQMFRRMRSSRRLSNRELARELAMSEGTVRNAIAYADLADTMGDDHQLIARMKVRDVQMAVHIGPIIAKPWIHGGCERDVLSPLFEWENESGERAAELIEKHRLEPLFCGNDLKSAIGMVKEAVTSLSDCSTLPGAEEAMRSLIDRGQSVAAFLEHFTFSVPDNTPTFTQDEWDAIVQRALDHEGDTAAAIAFQVNAARAAKRAGAVDAKNPYHFGALKRLETAPDFIRDAELFTLMERWYLADRYETVLQSDFREYAKEAMQSTIRSFQERRRMLLPTASEEEKRVASMLPADIDSLIGELAARLDRATDDAATKERDLLFADREKLTALIIDTVTKDHYRIREGVIGNRPAREVFAETVNAWSMAELAMVAAVVMEDRYPFERWFNAAEVECVTVTQPETEKRGIQQVPDIDSTPPDASCAIVGGQIPADGPKTGEVTTDEPASSPATTGEASDRFGVVKLGRGCWMLTYDGAIFMHPDNAWSNKKAALESARYHAERCEKEPEYERGIAQEAAYHAAAERCEFPIASRPGGLLGSEWFVYMPDHTECGPFDEKAAREQSANFKRQAKRDPEFLKSFRRESQVR